MLMVENWTEIKHNHNTELGVRGGTFFAKILVPRLSMKKKNLSRLSPQYKHQIFFDKTVPNSINKLTTSFLSLHEASKILSSKKTAQKLSLEAKQPCAQKKRSTIMKKVNK